MEDDVKHGRVEALRAASQGPARSKAAQLREIIDEVEAAIENGLAHKQIVALLERRGLKFSLGTFQITRHRILEERRKAGRSRIACSATPELGTPEAPVSAATPEQKPFEGMTAKQKREEKANQYLNQSSSNSILRNHQGDKNENED